MLAGLARLLHRLGWRLLRGRGQAPRRGGLASATLTRHARFGVLELEAYLLQINGRSGVGLSAYVGVEEILRFDCLGAGGHFHINLRQQRVLAGDRGAVQRLSFCSAMRRAQVEESLLRLQADLPATLRCNWRPDVRRQSVPEASLAAAVAWAREALSALDASVPSGNPGPATGG